MVEIEFKDSVDRGGIFQSLSDVRGIADWVSMFFQSKLNVKVLYLLHF